MVEQNVFFKIAQNLDNVTLLGFRDPQLNIPLQGQFKDFKFE